MPANTTSGGRSGNSNNNNRKRDGKMESLRSACPSHRRRDFDMLVKQLNGDEEKIQQKIQEWWEEPDQSREEEQWEDVNKKSSKKKDTKQQVGRGGRNGGGPGRGGRGYRAGGRGGGRGGRAERRPVSQNKQSQQPQPGGKNGEAAKKQEEGSSSQQGVPAPVTNAPTPKGAWGRAGGPQMATQGAGGAPSPEKAPASATTTTAKQEPEEESKPLEVGLVTQNDPTPSGLAPPVDSKSIRTTVPVSGNVWATKGSAHLIQAEKPKPPAPVAPPVQVAPVAPPAPIPPKPVAPEPEPPVSPPTPPVPEPIDVEPELEPPVVADESPQPTATPTLESGLPAAVSSAAWAKPEPPKASPSQSLDIPSSPAVVTESPLTALPPVSAVEESVSPKQPAPPAPPKPVRPAPTNVLNMGHWETGDGDDSQNLDFAFGSFGPDNEIGSMDTNTANSNTTNVAANTAAPPPPPEPVPEIPKEATTSPPTEPAPAAPTSVSPARPPPGLSIGGMPPMPANAVLVHELENKLEINAKPEQSGPTAPDKPAITTTLPPPQTNAVPPGPSTETVTSAPAPVLPSTTTTTAGITQQNYNQYGMAGMYNYPSAAAAGNGFVGVHTPAGPFVAGAGVVPQQPQKPGGITSQAPSAGPTPQNIPQHQAGLYGAHQSAPSSGNAVTSNDSNANTSSDNAPGPTTTGAMPPGMLNMPYANPAVYYGQQPFHPGQHQGGIGYNYGYGAQFGGAVQGGFGYQQVMGQSGGYGPHYDDQPPHQGSSHHSGGSGGYQKNSGGGYRGRNSHHNNNQYQGQYNPQQHGGYAGQPYGMGYHGDHFNQRGGYGHGGMGDPYGMQQQGSSNYQSGGIHSNSGFQDDDHHKGKKGGSNRNNSGTHNSLQQFQQGPPHQLGGQQQPFGLQGQDSQTTPVTGGSGGWSNQGGWSGGAPSWQQGS